MASELRTKQQQIQSILSIAVRRCLSSQRTQEDLPCPPFYFQGTRIGEICFYGINKVSPIIDRPRRKKHRTPMLSRHWRLHSPTTQHALREWCITRPGRKSTTSTSRRTIARLLSGSLFLAGILGVSGEMDVMSWRRNCGWILVHIAHTWLRHGLRPSSNLILLKPSRRRKRL